MGLLSSLKLNTEHRLMTNTDQLNDGETNIFGGVLIEHGLTTQAWLLSDRDNDNLLDNVDARLNFGYYRGSDRVIYWKEVHN